MADTPNTAPVQDNAPDNGPSQLNTPPYPGTSRIENGQAFDVKGNVLGAVDDNGQATGAPAGKPKFDPTAPIQAQTGKPKFDPNSPIELQPAVKPTISYDPQRGAAEATSIGPAPQPSFWERVKNMFTEGAPEGSLMASAGHVHQSGDESKTPQLISPEAVMTPSEQERHPILSETGKFAGGLTSPQNVAMLAALGGVGEAPAIARGVITGLTAVGFGAPIIKQAATEVPEFRDAMLGTGKYADMSEEDRTREAEKLLTRTVLGAAMITEMGKGVYESGEHIGGGGETNAGLRPQTPSAIDRAATATKDAAVNAVKNAATKIPDAVTYAGMRTLDVIGKALGKTDDFDTAIARSSKIPAKQTIDHAEKIANVREDLQAILNENADRIEDPKSFADAIDNHIKNNENRLQAEAGATKGSDEPVVQNLSQRITDRLDKFFDDNKGLYGDDAQVGEAKKKILEGVLQTRNGQHLLEPNLFEAENIRRRLNRESAPQYATNATPTTDAYKAGALEAAKELRGAIDESYQAKGVDGVQEWRGKEADLIDVRDKIRDAQDKADKMGEGKWFRSLMNKVGVPSTVVAIALNHPLSGTAVAAGILGDKILQNRTNPNVNINRAINLASRNEGATATEPTFGKPPAAEAPPDHALHAELATHFNSVLDKTTLDDLQTRFLNGVRDKAAKNIPFTPEEKDILGKINQSKAKTRAAQDVAAKKTLEAQQKETERIATAAQAAREAAAQKTKESIDRAKERLKTSMAAVEVGERPTVLNPHLDSLGRGDESGLVSHTVARKAHAPTQDIAGLGEGITSEDAHRHEWAHLAMDAIDGVPAGVEIRSDKHPSVSPGAGAASVFNIEALVDKSGNVDPEKLGDSITKWVSQKMAGPASHEVFNGMTKEEAVNHSVTRSDIRQARNIVRSVHPDWSDGQVGEYLDAAYERARNFLTQPHIADRIKANAAVREEGLPDTLHASRERVSNFQKDIREAHNEQGTDDSGPSGGTSGKGGEKAERPTGEGKEEKNGRGSEGGRGQEPRGSDGENQPARGVSESEVSKGDEEYQVTDRQTGDVVSTHANKKSALRRADKLDEEYGGIRYKVQPAPPKIRGDVESEVSKAVEEKKPLRIGTPAQPYEESKLPYSQPVKVTWPDGDVHTDEVRGLNSGHALARARSNWEGAKVEPNGTGRLLESSNIDKAAKGLTERSVGNPEHDEAIRQGGGIPAGVLGHLNEDHVKMFHDPQTGTTLGFGSKESVTAEAVKAKLEASRAQYAAAKAKKEVELKDHDRHFRNHEGEQ